MWGACPGHAGVTLELLNTVAGAFEAVDECTDCAICKDVDDAGAGSTEDTVPTVLTT